jgi:hypothetical protein
MPPTAAPAFLEIEDYSNSFEYDDDDDDGNGDTNALLDNGNKYHGNHRNGIHASGGKGTSFVVRLLAVIAFVGLASMLRPALLTPGVDETVTSGSHASYYNYQNSKKKGSSGGMVLPVNYECPAITEYKPQGVDQASWYDEKSREIATNVTQFLSDFREAEFDNWGHSYEEVKKGMYHWKSNMFRELKDGASIYESACGIGLNMYMTLEIMQEELGLTNVIVYGNEYVPESVDIAREVWNADRRESLPSSAVQGRICTGDSSDLKEVPSAAFDFVYTGYITPTMDPLNLNGSSDDNYDRLTEICVSEEDPEEVKLAVKAQESQNDWYGQWVGEMIRIAKPGAPVIVEQVSHAFCSAKYDWGGVDQDFWRPAVDRYHWDVDPDSFVFEKDTIFRKRYHVYMKKNQREEWNK